MTILPLTPATVDRIAYTAVEHALFDAADRAVFDRAPVTPLDVLGIAQTRRDTPELALALAPEAGRRFDRDNRR